MIPEEVSSSGSSYAEGCGNSCLDVGIAQDTRIIAGCSAVLREPPGFCIICIQFAITSCDPGT
ncbi:MAG: hypothetical protein NTV68_00135 [Methanomicrobiales archaeon]|nr:hypothetical protein [Methanomicrobiales archaeon]